MTDPVLLGLCGSLRTASLNRRLMLEGAAHWPGRFAEGSLRPCDPDKAARVIVSMAVGMVLQSALDPAGSDWQQAAQAGMDLLLAGLVRREP